MLNLSHYYLKNAFVIVFLESIVLPFSSKNNDFLLLIGVLNCFGIISSKVLLYSLKNSS